MYHDSSNVSHKKSENNESSKPTSPTLFSFAPHGFMPSSSVSKPRTAEIYTAHHVWCFSNCNAQRKHAQRSCDCFGVLEAHHLLEQVVQRVLLRSAVIFSSNPAPSLLLRLFKRHEVHNYGNKKHDKEDYTKGYTNHVPEHTVAQHVRAVKPE